jgi:hypothetical protein
LVKGAKIGFNLQSMLELDSDVFAYKYLFQDFNPSHSLRGVFLKT